jgi:S1-C subfamily serine protease
MFQAAASELADKGRAIFKQHQKSVVTVQVVLKTRFTMQGSAGQSGETRQDISGTVIDPSGLVVLSLTATDPSQIVQNAAGDDARFKIETELSDVKFLLDDGNEIPAEVVLRDKDLDLAFARPKTPLTTPMAALDFSNSGKAEVLEELISINRLGNAGGRAYAANAERVSAIVQRPRLFYVPESSMSTTTLGSPAFTLDGKVLGLFVMRSTKGRSGGMTGISTDMVAGIIVPADAVLKAAKQVPVRGEAKAGDEKSDEAKKADADAPAPEQNK